ncbi:MAG: hypothetical protein K2H01_07010 [Ruminococcus sp.]|nr:hypothetical protein [Ruminococcus sp.]
MKNNFKKALEEAYEFKKPSRKDEFFQSIDKKNKPVPFYIRSLKYSAVPITAAIAAIICTGFIKSNSNVKVEFVSENMVNTTCNNYNSHDNENIQTSTTIEAEMSDILTFETSETETYIANSTYELPEISSYIIYQNYYSQYIYYQTDNITKPIVDDIFTQTTTITTVKTTDKTIITNTSNTTVNEPVINTTTTTPKNNFSATITTPQTKATTTTPKNDSTITIPAPQTTATTTTPKNDSNDSTITIPSAIEPDPYVPDYNVKDMRITPYVIYNKTDNIIDVSKLISINNPLYPNVSWTDHDHLQLANTSAAVYGSIENVYYTSVDSIPYIQADIMVIHSMRNDDFHYGDKLSIYVPGGYMPLREFINSHKWAESELKNMTDSEINAHTAFYNNGNSNILSVGSKYLFFIKSGLEEMPNGAFTLCNEADIYRQSNGKYVCATNSDISFSATELKKYLK